MDIAGKKALVFGGTSGIGLATVITSYSIHYTKLYELRPGIDGVVLRHGRRSATFLPQVWRQLPIAEKFLDHLCLKAGLPQDAWRQGNLDIHTYQVQCFDEEAK